MNKIKLFIYKLLKKLLRREHSPLKKLKVFYVYKKKSFPNKTDLFYGENIGQKIQYYECNYSSIKKTKLKNEKEFNDPYDAWKAFIKNSIVPKGWKNSSFMLTGFILEKQEWCLSSWIWTSSSIVRTYINIGEVKLANLTCQRFMEIQEKFGGWVVRHDYTNDEVIPIVAPNDSAYIANNAFLTMYCENQNQIYLEAAERTAKWIMQTTSDYGIVYYGIRYDTMRWIKDKNIVDIGFTIALFANLYTYTKKKLYLEYAETFANSYIDLFYNHKANAFSTAINNNLKQFGGNFARGQAWALEGLVPLYKINHSLKLKIYIISTINTLIKKQNTNGSWAYNLSRKFLGEDGKGTPVITYSLLQWYKIFPSERLKITILNAHNWCKKATLMSGKGVGGIYSKNLEGAIVHSLYTSTAFTYSSGYAIENEQMIKKYF